MTIPTTQREADERTCADEIMFEVYEYARLSDGIDSLEGDDRVRRRELMAKQAAKIRASLTPIAATDQPSAGRAGERIEDALREGERRGRAVIDNHLQMMETNRHYRERVFNAIVQHDAKQGLHRFVRASLTPTTPQAAKGRVVVPVELPPIVVDAVAKASYDLDDTARTLVKEEWACTIGMLGLHGYLGAPQAATTASAKLDEIFAAIDEAQRMNRYNESSFEIGKRVARLKCLADYFRAAPGAAQTTDAREGWLPIETAPKDGTEVLLYLKEPYSEVRLARWFEPWLNWIEGEFPDPERDEHCGIGSACPSHWMPLPSKPTDKGQTNE